jgi:hypothetical protein
MLQGKKGNEFVGFGVINNGEDNGFTIDVPHSGKLPFVGAAVNLSRSPTVSLVFFLNGKRAPNKPGAQRRFHCLVPLFLSSLSQTQP